MIQSSSTETADSVTWDPPDGGLWSLETAHYGGVSPVPLRSDMETSFADGFRASFARLGVPLSHVELRHINGWPYTSFFLHDAPRKAGPPPPDLVLKILTRVHPGFRKRTKIAAAALDEGRPLSFAADWEEERDGWIKRILDLQRVDRDALGDVALAAHVDDVRSLFSDALRRHFELVSGCIPLGAWFVRTAEWGLDPGSARRAVMHGTPVHTEAADRLSRIALALGDATPSNLDDIRGHSEAAADALTDYLDHHGWWASEDSVRSRPLIEYPDMVVSAIRAAQRAPAHPVDAPDLLASLRDSVPATDRDEFDRVARDAHRSYVMLDDNSGILGSWATGIAGTVVRYAGTRLQERGALADADHVWALSVDEITQQLEGRSSLDAEHVAARYAAWEAQNDLDPPLHLNGEPSPPPDAELFPAPVARLMSAIGAFLGDKFNDAEEASGIGSQPVTGRAVVVASASDALDRLQPGDILVTTATTPAYMSVLPIVGGLVVSEGGPSCHAAVVARELDLSAVVGLKSATTTIPDGAIIELDPVKGTVTLVP